MSSPPPPSPPRSQPLHNSELHPDPNQSTKTQSTNSINQGHKLPQSSSSKKQPFSGNAAAPGQSTLKRSYIIDWLHGRLPQPSTDNSSGGSYTKPDLNTKDSS
ncbi:hypothetical protein ACH5RR_023705 [Cinchona calisaya]|uniref:Uncharacterized protein n=1 Tax=Cinchona calisaya TaxID=153742 RepID=A0ABD2ZCJ2_9GENT